MKVLSSLALLAATATALPRLQDGNTDLPVQKRQFRLIPVVVGGPQDTFVPNSVNAAVGDVIQFQFSNGNHTVTQSTETTPCQPLQQTNANAIHSGHIPFQDGQATVGTFNMPVTNTDPLFLYCATGPHCQEGQVMIVNPISPEQVVKFNKAAAGAAANIDGTTVVGGAVGSIALTAAAFVPAPAQQGGPPGGAPGGAPPAGAPPAAAPPAEGAPATPPAATSQNIASSSQLDGATTESSVSTTAAAALPSVDPNADGVGIPVTVPPFTPGSNTRDLGRLIP